MDDTFYFFTFGAGSVFCDKYVKIQGSYLETRKVMNDTFGPRWAFQYDAERFDHQPDEYGLTELVELRKNSFGSWRPVPKP